MHPGNLLVRLSPGNAMPSLVLLDCGVASSLSEKDWINLRELFLAVIQREVSVVMQIEASLYLQIAQLFFILY